MISESSVSSKRLNVADKTADMIYSLLNIDKTRAIDTYDIAKKIGLCSNKYSSNYVDLKKIRTNNNQSANNDRFLLAEAIAKYIIFSAFPGVDFSNLDTKSTISDLALSLVIPRSEATRIYNNLDSKKVDKKSIITDLAIVYGVNEDIAKKRLNQIIAEEDLKNVLHK